MLALSGTEVNLCKFSEEKNQGEINHARLANDKLVWQYWQIRSMRENEISKIELENSAKKKQLSKIHNELVSLRIGTWRNREKNYKLDYVIKRYSCLGFNELPSTAY